MIIQAVAQYIINWAILVSHIVNVIIGGSAYEMLCTRCWRLRHKAPWKQLQFFFDYVAWPLNQWRHPGMTHCESCHFDEYWRLTKECRRNCGS